MRIRWIALATLFLFVIAAVIGVVEKNTYTNVAAEENPLEYFQVGIFQDDLIPAVGSPEFEELVREESKYIVKVEAVSDLQFEFLHTNQLFKVLEVYQGNGLSEGEEITIVLESGYLYFDEDSWAANMGFADKKEVGKEYLAYLNSELEIPNSEYRVFTVPGVLVPPFFAYEDGQSCPTLESGISGTGVDYELVQGNEYFAQTKQGLETLLTYKEHMMEGYN